jgi:hypothetical protein
MPGWQLRTLAADVLRREAGADAAAARALGEELLLHRPSDPAVEAMHTALRVVLGKPDHVLHHDDLAADSRGFYLDEVASAAARHGLHYVGESHLADCAPGDDTDLVRREVLHDYRVNRMFRSSLFGRRPLGPPRPGAVRDLWVSAPVVALGGRSFELLRGIKADVDAELAGDLVRIGAAWPTAVRGDTLRADPEAFLTLYANKAVEFACEPVPAVKPSSHPFVVSVMRRMAEQGRLLATVRQEPLRLEDDRSRLAVSLMDGLHSRADIAGALRRGSEDRVRKDLDDLIEALGQKGLFVDQAIWKRPPAQPPPVTEM